MDIVGFVKKKIENKKLQKIKERERYQNYKRVLMEEEQRLKENEGKENLLCRRSAPVHRKQLCPHGQHSSHCGPFEY